MDSILINIYFTKHWLKIGEFSCCRIFLHDECEYIKQKLYDAFVEFLADKLK